MASDKVATYAVIRRCRHPADHAVIEPGARVDLDDSQAVRLGDAVMPLAQYLAMPSPDAPPPRPPKAPEVDYVNRPAGRYCVVRRSRHPETGGVVEGGALIDLTAAQARELGTAVTLLAVTQSRKVESIKGGGHASTKP